MYGIPLYNAVRPTIIDRCTVPSDKMAEVDSVVAWEKKYEDTDGVCPLKHMSRFAPLEVLSLSLNIVTLVIVKTKPIKVNI